MTWLMVVARERQNSSPSGPFGSRPRALESWWMGWMTTKPWAAQKSASGP
jgi:hypothetical protein